MYDEAPVEVVGYGEGSGLGAAIGPTDGMGIEPGASVSALAFFAPKYDQRRNPPTANTPTPKTFSVFESLLRCRLFIIVVMVLAPG
jgi:hypothetical protein